MIKDFLIVETSTYQCAAESQINGIPLCRLTPTTSILDSRPVHQFLLPDRNILTLVVEPGPTPTQALAPAAQPFSPKPKTMASLRLMSMPRGSFPEDPGVRELLRIDWRPAPGQPVATPVVLVKSIGIPSVGKRWSWLGGDPLEGAASLQAIAGMISALRAGFEHRDPEPFIARAQVRFREASEAYELSVDDEVRKFREQFQRLSGEPGFQMQPLDAEQMDLRVCASGKLVDCVDRSWEPLLRSTKLPDGSTRLRYPIKVASLAGTLQIVR